MFNINHSFISRYGHRKRSNSTYYSLDNCVDRNYYNPYDEYKKLKNKENSLDNLNQGQKRGNQISKTTQRKIRNRVFYMNLISEEKSRINKKGNTLKYNLTFLTVTISGECLGGIRESNKKLLNTLLMDLRRNCNMLNYIWRLELQKNGKVHYHIITDASVNYKYLRHVWNRIQIEAGTMEAFTKKFSKMTYNDYADYMVKTYPNIKNISKLPEWYAKGRREKWENPNSVDVVYVNDAKQINYYISKYISKSEDEDSPEVEEVKPELMNGRIWGSSQELANAQQITHHLQDVAEFAYFASMKHLGETEVIEEYCSYIRVNWVQLFGLFPWIKETIKERLNEFADLKPSSPPKLGLFTFT